MSESGTAEMRDFPNVGAMHRRKPLGRSNYVGRLPGYANAIPRGMLGPTKHRALCPTSGSIKTTAGNPHR